MERYYLASGMGGGDKVIERNVVLCNDVGCTSVDVPKAQSVNIESN